MSPARVRMVVYSPDLEERALRESWVKSRVDEFRSVRMSLVHPARIKAWATALPMPTGSQLVSYSAIARLEWPCAHRKSSQVGETHRSRPHR